MTPKTLLAESARRGIKLYVDGPAIRYRGPKSAIADLKPELAAKKSELLTLLRAQREETEISRPACADSWKPPTGAGHPAYSILTTCRRYGVLLRIDPETGDLVVGKTGASADEQTQPWPSLLRAIEAHLDAVAVLVKSGWIVTAEWRGRVTTQ
jgi:hypothetical protein